MTHLDEGTILSIRDGAQVDVAARSHLTTCTTCEGALEAARARAERVERTLTALDGPVGATAAKAGVRARLRPIRGERPSRRWASQHLGRAAALLLVTAGTAAALSWSPARNLWSSSPPAPANAPPIPPSVSETPSVPSGDATPSGITVAVADGFVHVVVRGAAPGSEITVTWTDRRTASLTAPPGSRFTYSSGRVEVDASRGSLGMELPRDAQFVSVEVDGDLYLTGSADALEVSGPAFERTDESIRFRVSER